MVYGLKACSCHPLNLKNSSSGLSEFFWILSNVHWANIWSLNFDLYANMAITHQEYQRILHQNCPNLADYCSMSTELTFNLWTFDWPVHADIAITHSPGASKNSWSELPESCCTIQFPLGLHLDHWTLTCACQDGHHSLTWSIKEFFIRTIRVLLYTVHPPLG